MKEILQECLTDRALVIFCLTLIAFAAFYTMGEGAESVITAIVSGLCGIAVGKHLKH